MLWLKGEITLKEEIILCNSCQGTGITYGMKREHYGYDTKYFPTVCKDCKGSGRLIKTITIKPYEQDKKI